MDKRSVTLLLALIFFSFMAIHAEDATSEPGADDDQPIKTKRHLLVVRRQAGESGESESDENVSSSLQKRSLQDDQHRPINDETDSLGPLIAKLHRKRCARTTTTAATTTTTAAG